MATLFCILLGFACVAVSIGEGRIIDFISLPSLLIVLGGSVMATLASYPFDRIKSLLKAASILFRPKPDLNNDIEELIRIAYIARHEGLLSLESIASESEDEYLQKGLMLVADGTDQDLIKNILETELAYTKERHAGNRAVLDTAAAYAPAFGMVGTLIGLINMLTRLSDLSALGSSMSMALITTLYGLLAANLIFNPLSRKLKAAGAAEYLRKELLLEGMLSIQNGINPRIIRIRLEAFLAKSRQNGDEASITVKESISRDQKQKRA